MKVAVSNLLDSNASLIYKMMWLVSRPRPLQLSNSGPSVLLPSPTRMVCKTASLAFSRACKTHSSRTSGWRHLSAAELESLFRKTVYNWHGVPAVCLDDDDIGYALYPHACNFNHACSPSCKWEIERGKDIAADTEVTISYFGHATDRITQQRRQFLRDNYQFECDCIRCEREADCAVCGNEGWKRCSRCKSVHYCSAGCQQTDWPLHKKSCIPVSK